MNRMGWAVCEAALICATLAGPRLVWSQPADYCCSTCDVTPGIEDIYAFWQSGYIGQYPELSITLLGTAQPNEWLALYVADNPLGPRQLVDTWLPISSPISGFDTTVTFIDDHRYDRKDNYYYYLEHDFTGDLFACSNHPVLYNAVGDRPDLGAPENVSVTDVPADRGHALRVSWSTSHPVGATIDRYNIYRSSADPYSPMAYIGSRPPGATTFVDNNAAENVTFTYKVSTAHHGYFSNPLDGNYAIWNDFSEEASGVPIDDFASVSLSLLSDDTLFVDSGEDTLVVQATILDSAGNPSMGIPNESLWLIAMHDSALYCAPDTAVADSATGSNGQTTFTIPDVRGYGAVQFTMGLAGSLYLFGAVTVEIRAKLVRSYVWKHQAGTFVSAPDTVAFGCPQGDADQLLFRVDIDTCLIEGPLSAGDITLMAPVDTLVSFFSETFPITADEAPSIVGDHFSATVTVPYFGGCGSDSARLQVKGIDVGYAHFYVKSPDFDLSTDEPLGAVTLSDFGQFGSHFPSSQCNCLPNYLAYSSCADYLVPGDAALILEDTTVTLADFTEFGAHWPHAFDFGGGGALVTRSYSMGTVVARIVEEDPLLGDRLLRVYLETHEMERSEAMLVALTADNEKMKVLGWHPNDDFEGVTLFSEVHERTGRNEVILGVLARGQHIAGENQLGHFSVKLDSDAHLSDDDFRLVDGGLLLADVQRTLALRVGEEGSELGFHRVVEPARYVNQLAQNYPNPFNPSTTIAFSLASRTNVELAIYNVRGAVVRALVDDQLEAGNYKEPWDGRNDHGQAVASGVYFYRLRAGSFSATKKMVLLR